MVRLRLLLTSALLLAALLAAGQAAPQATEASRCYIGGNARRQICVCIVNGRPTNVPMTFCGRRR